MDLMTHRLFAFWRTVRSDASTAIGGAHASRTGSALMGGAVGWPSRSLRVGFSRIGCETKFTPRIPTQDLSRCRVSPGLAL